MKISGSTVSDHRRQRRHRRRHRPPARPARRVADPGRSRRRQAGTPSPLNSGPREARSCRWPAISPCPASLPAWFRMRSTRLGTIDILINCAGVQNFGFFRRGKRRRHGDAVQRQHHRADRAGQRRAAAHAARRERGRSSMSAPFSARSVFPVSLPIRPASSRCAAFPKRCDASWREPASASPTWPRALPGPPSIAARSPAWRMP